jgi:hypothetical protein
LNAASWTAVGTIALVVVGVWQVMSNRRKLRNKGISPPAFIKVKSIKDSHFYDILTIGMGSFIDAEEVENTKIENVSSVRTKNDD